MVQKLYKKTKKNAIINYCTVQIFNEKINLPFERTTKNLQNHSQVTMKYF